MASGFKSITFRTGQPYTVAALYEAIKDFPFTAGRPALTRQGQTEVITFPPLDAGYQLWLTQSQLGKPPFTQWQVFPGKCIRPGGSIVSRMRGMLGGAGAVRRLLETTVSELRRLEL